MTEGRNRPIAMVGRRALIGSGLALAPGLVTTARADAPDEMPPQVGDRFTQLVGPTKGQIVKVGDLDVGGPQVQVYPVDSKTNTVRDGSPLNIVLLTRFDPASLSDETRSRAAGGVVAYSATCTHQGCPVNMWQKEQSYFVCSCHGSVYNPRDGAQVMFGPAPRPLPYLPLRLEGEEVVVAGEFTSRVGPELS